MSFFTFVRHGEATATPPIAARYSVTAGSAATASLRQGGIPVDEPRFENEIAAYFEGQHPLGLFVYRTVRFEPIWRIPSS